VAPPSLVSRKSPAELTKVRRGKFEGHHEIGVWGDHAAAQRVPQAFPY
jgi:hypothetical protein